MKLAIYYFRYASSRIPLVLTRGAIKVEMVSPSASGKTWKVRYLQPHPDGTPAGTFHYVKFKKLYPFIN